MHRFMDELCSNCNKFSHCNNNDLICILKYKILEQKCEELKDKNQYLINTYCHFKNEIKKYKKAVHKYKVVLRNKIERLHLSRRQFLKEINSVTARIACEGKYFKNALNNFNNAIQVINNEDKYKQALDEVENIIEHPLVHLDEEIYNAISDIINKAKEK
nr:MAG TPA: hypothetical protein [Caudoviricetes sp.]